MTPDTAVQPDRIGRQRRRDARRYVLGRLAMIPVSALVVLSMSFFLVNLVPSDPVRTMLGNFASTDEIARIRSELGLDRPILVRFWDYITDVFGGSMGTSYYEPVDVLPEILDRFTSTALLVIAGFVSAWLLGVMIAMVMATSNSLLSRTLSGIVSVLQSVPDFVLALVGILIFYSALQVVPAPLGQLPIGSEPPPDVTGAVVVDALLAGQMGTFFNAAQQYVLPVAALALGNCVIFARTTAAALRTSLDGKNAEFSRALGLPPTQIVLLAMRSSLLPTIAISGQVLAHLFGGVAIIEKVFNWQGLGHWGVDGVLRSDLPVAQGFVVVVAIMAMLSYFAADLLMFAADPRIRQERTAQVATRRARRQAWLSARGRTRVDSAHAPMRTTAVSGGETP